jgi:hypothetical protein
VLHGPQPAGGRVERCRLHVAVAVREDLGARPGAAHERVVVGHRAVGAQTHDLADERAELLRLLAEARAVALRDVQHPVAAEQEPRAEVSAALHLGFLPVDHPHVGQRRCVLAQAPAGDGGARGPADAGLGVRQVDEAVHGERRVEGDVEQPALAAREHRRHARDRRGDGAGSRDDA